MRDVKPREVAAHLAEANLPLLLVSSVIVTLTFPARAVRWRILLAREAPAVPFGPFWRATAIGFMANNVLPARAGELARAVAGSRLLGVPTATALASIAVERVFDGLILVLLLSLAIASPDFPSRAAVHGTSVSTVAAWMGAVFAAGLVFLFAMVHAPERALTFTERLLHRLIPARAASFVSRLIRGALAGLAVLRTPRDFLRVVLWSFVVWLLNAAAYSIGFYAFGLGDLPATASLLLQGLVALGVAIPSSPGFFGIFEALSRESLALYGVPGGPAFSYAVGIHLAWFIPITVAGLFILARAGLSLGDIRRPETAP
jgi:uncharacterized protein (TIRG00374 family)